MVYYSAYRLFAVFNKLKPYEIRVFPLFLS